MSMAHLIVTDFGAIKSANIEIKKYNFFIGHTSSGKSTIAKLLAIFNNSIFWTIKEGDFNSFLRLLDKYNINFEFTSTTIIRYSNEKYYWEIGLNKFHSNYEDADLMEMANTSKSYDFILKFIERKENNFAYKEFIKSLKNLLDLKDSAMVELIKPALVGLLYEECIPVYIPAERLLISTFSNSIFSLLQAGASIPDCIKDFGSLYEKARIQYKNIDILVEVNDSEVIVIEDKVKTSSHSNQLERYKDTIDNEEFYKNYNKHYIYYKVGNESQNNGVEQAGYTRIKRDEILNIIKKYRDLNNDLLNDYIDYLESIEKTSNMYKEEDDINKWDWETWEGYYNHLQLKDDIKDGYWHYVSNPKGGFLAFIWNCEDYNYVKDNKNEYIKILYIN